MDTVVFETALAAIEAAHADQITTLRERADAAEQARLAAQALADRALAQLADASARADAEITALRDVVDGLRGTIAREEQRAANAERRATEAEWARAAALHSAEQARAVAQDLVEGLRRDLDAARGEVQQAQERAEALRAATDELKAGQAHIEDAHAAELAAAQDAARTAEEAAEALRQAEAERQGRGRWARLKAAWRGDK